MTISDDFDIKDLRFKIHARVNAPVQGITLTQQEAFCTQCCMKVQYHHGITEGIQIESPQYRCRCGYKAFPVEETKND